MQTTLFFDSKKGFGQSQDFVTNFNPPLELKNSSNYQVSLINATMWYSWYNITDENNKLNYYNGSTWKTIAIPSGAYNITDLVLAIKRLMQVNSDWDETNHKYDIDIKPNFNTLKSIIELKNGYKVDFTIANILRVILGFNSKTIQGNGFHDSENAVQITDIHSIQIHCDVVTDSYINGSTSSVIYTFSPTIPPGYLIQINPMQRFTINITKRGLINSIRFSLRNQNGDLINMNNERVTYFLHLSEII